MVSLSRFQSTLTHILHLKESPHRTALAFAVGAFIAFSPTYGLHTVGALVCVWAFRLNAVALIAGSLINNPWTFVPILGATLWTGLQLLGMPQVPPLDWNNLSPLAIYEQIMPYAIPFFFGGFVLSVLGAALSYPAAYFVLTTYRARKERAGIQQLPPTSGLG